jgi:hypothetical protein
VGEGEARYRGLQFASRGRVLVWEVGPEEGHNRLGETEEDLEGQCSYQTVVRMGCLRRESAMEVDLLVVRKIGREAGQMAAHMNVKEEVQLVESKNRFAAFC